MTRRELIEKMANELKMTRKESTEMIEWFFGSIVEALRTDSRFSASGFGSFTVNTRKARKARNPRTGEEVEVPPRKTVKFNPSSKMKEYLNSKK